MNLISEKDFHFIPNVGRHSILGEIVGLTAPIYRQNYSIAVTHLEPGGSGEKHYHAESDEVYLFTSGHCTMKINDRIIRTEPGMVVIVEPPDLHEILPCEEEVTFYTFSIPPFKPEDYIIPE